MELNCPSLDYVNKMTWAEFQIRSYGWRRMDERKQFYLKKVASAPLLAMGVKPNEVDKFWVINKRKRLEEIQALKQKMLLTEKKALSQYLKDVENAKK